MSTFWTASSFNYYLITFFLKYIPGNIYTNTAVSTFAEIIANLVSGWLVSYLGLRISYITAFAIATAGGVCMILLSNWDNAMAIFVLVSKFGVSFAFNNCYIGIP